MNKEKPIKELTPYEISEDLAYRIKRIQVVLSTKSKDYLFELVWEEIRELQKNLKKKKNDTDNSHST